MAQWATKKTDTIILISLLNNIRQELVVVKMVVERGECVSNCLVFIDPKEAPKFPSVFVICCVSY